MISFSILIPNYGYNNSLLKCLLSAARQKINENFYYQIILFDQSSINDFDKITNLIENNEELYKKVLVLHTNDKGLLKARYSLMSYSNCDYIVFLDSDDYLSETCLIDLYKQIVDFEYPDILIHPLISTNDKHTYENVNYIPEKYINKPFDYFLYSSSINSICCKCFKRKLYNRGDYSLTDIIVGEDKYFSFPIMKKAETIVVSNNCLTYYYVNNPSSIMHNIDYNEHIKYITFYDNCYIKTKSNMSNLSLLAKDKLLLISSVLKYAFTNKEEKSEIISLLREFVHSYNAITQNFKIKLTFKKRLLLYLIRKEKISLLRFYYCSILK